MPAPAAPPPYTILTMCLVTIVIFFFAWLVTGGPTDSRSRAGILLNPPSPLGSGEPYGAVPNVLQQAVRTLPSPASRRIVLSTGVLAGTRLLFLTPSATTSSIGISDWRLVNGRGAVAQIPLGTERMVQGVLASGTPITLARREQAILGEASSPVGVSFKLDKCSGFLADFQNFTPPLSKTCPSPRALADRALSSPQDEACARYVANLPSCSTGGAAGLSTLSPSCRNYVGSVVNQRSCTKLFGKDYDFSYPEWRVYLGKQGFLSAVHDTIYFYDADNREISSVNW